MIYVCKTAIEALGDSDQFPKDWLMKYRWGKGKKDGGKLPNGAKITFLKVGGRTSAVVPSVQKKTGAVAGDVKEDTNGDEEEEDEPKPKRGNKRKTKAVKEEDDDDQAEAGMTTPANTKRARRKLDVDEIKEEDAEPTESETANSKKGKGRAQKETAKSEEVTGRRRSGRLAGA
jgi:formamidopyrimidine-DNA glycosylase